MTGERVGNYEIVRELARGGMAVVYLAHQPALDRLVALKRLDVATGHPSLAKRFVDEARVVARLDHPHIVTVHDFCEHEGTPYIAMEYVSGGSLRPRVGHLDLPQTIGILHDLLDALEHAAEHHVTHRDLKPENVLVTPRGDVKVADFGIALAHDAVTRLTSTGAALGTPVYMAPEQASNGRVDPRTDLYAVGVMAYEMLAGRPPFPAGDAPVAILYRHVHEAVPPLREIAPEVPAALGGWVEQLLAKDPADRPQSARTARKRLERIAVTELGPYWRQGGNLATGADELPTLLAPTVPNTEERRGARNRHTRRVALLAVGAAAIAAVVAALALRDGDEPGGADSAPPPRRVAAPFEFDGANGQMVTGLPGWDAVGAPAGSGAVLVAGPRGKVRMIGADTLEHDRRRADFGSAVASGDFDADGHADLAVGAPGARAGADTGRPGAVAVIHGADGGLGDRVTVLVGSDDHLPGGGGRYGASLAAGDLNGDAVADLVVGAPETDPFPREDEGSGTIQLLFGGEGGLTAERAETIRRTRPGDAEFGTLVAIGDVNGDRREDIVEAARDHAGYCAGAADGPTACRPMIAHGTTALAVADLTGDGRPEVVHGVAGAEQSEGALRVYRGTDRGPGRRPSAITQDGPHMPGHGQPGDRFGASLAAADLDDDGFEDLLVGAPGEDDDAGRISIVRGASGGYAKTSNRGLEQNAPDLPDMPGTKRAGNAFGTAVALAQRAEGRFDLAVAAPGEGRAGTVWIVGSITPRLRAGGATRRLSLASLDGRGSADRMTLAG